MQPTKLETTVARDGAMTRLVVRGDVDALSREDFIAAACAALEGTDQLDIDVGGVAFCDTVGISAFIGVRKIADAQGKAMRLRNPSPHVAGVLERTGLSTLLDGRAPL